MELEYGRPHPCASHTFAVLSRLAGDDPGTVRAELRVQHHVRVAVELEYRRPVCASHTFAAFSPLRMTIRVPSGLNDVMSASA